MMIIYKTAHTPITVVGNEVWYKIILRNDSEDTIQDITISDRVNEHLKFIKGSLRCNGIEGDGDIIAGIRIPILPKSLKEDYVIEYKVEVLSAPSNKEIISTTSGTYNYKELRSQKSYLKRVESNAVHLQVYEPRIEVEVYQDKKIATIGDSITYQVELMNTGDLNCVNVLVNSTFNRGVELVQGTVYLDYKQIHVEQLEKGINIQYMQVGEKKILSYQMEIKDGNSEGWVANETTVEATYVLPDQTVGNGLFKGNKLVIESGIRCFRQVLLDKHLILPDSEADISEIDDVEVQLEITEYYKIDTPISISVEGSRLTGSEMVINGILKIEMSYVSTYYGKGICFVQYRLPFNTSVVLPRYYNQKKKIKPNGVVLGKQYGLKTERSFYIGTLIEIKCDVIE